MPVNVLIVSNEHREKYFEYFMSRNRPQNLDAYTNAIVRLLLSFIGVLYRIIWSKNKNFKL